MKLSFYPKRGASPQWPGKGVGDYSHAGRTFNADSRAHEADAAPFTVESHDRFGRLTREAQVFAMELCKRDGDVHPADKLTADFCGVPFVEMAQDDEGEWVPKPAAKPSMAPKKPASTASEGA